MKHHLRIIFTTIDPLHISSGETGLYADTDGNRVTSQGSVPLTRTTRMRLAARPDEEYSPYLPYFSGSAIGGRLRREARDIICKILAAKGQKLDLGYYNILSCGARTASPDGNTSINRHLESAAHPYAGIFGGGPQMFRKRMITGAAWAVCKESIDREMVDEDFMEVSTKLQNMLQFVYYRRADDSIMCNNPLAPQVIKNYPDSLLAWVEQIEGRQAARDKTREEKKAVQAAKKAGDTEGAKQTISKSTKLDLETFNALEVVCPGVTLVSRQIVDTEGPGPAGLGLYLHALMGIAKNPRIGGSNRNNFGYINVKATLQTEQGTVNVFIKNNGQPEFNLDCPTIADALDAFAAYEPNITAANIEHVYRSTDTE